MKQEINEMEVIKHIKMALENASLNVAVTPVMFSPDEFMPVVGILVKNDDGSYIKKYTVTVKSNN
jgi:hypothetical protein